MNSLSRISVIYMILCAPTGKYYVGQTINLSDRWRDHRKQLRKNKHGNIYLQHAWDKYGESSFVISVLEECTPACLTEREQYWIDKLQPFGERGFNINPLAGESPMKGKTHTPEARAKIGIASTGRIGGMTGKVVSEETKAKLRAANLGKKQSPEASAKKSIAGMGRPCPTKGKIMGSPSAEVRAKLSLALKGRIFSDETRKKMSIAAKARVRSQSEIENMGKNNRKQYVVTTPDGIELEVFDLKAFCLLNGLTSSGMYATAKGKQSNHKGWKCRYA